MRPNNACQNLNFTSTDHSMQNFQNTLGTTGDGGVADTSLNLSSLFSTPIFVDMGSCLYDKAATDVQNAPQTSNFERRSNADEFSDVPEVMPPIRGSVPFKSTEESYRTQTIRPQTSRQQPFAEPEFVSVPLSRRPLPAQQPEYFRQPLPEPPVLARIPKLSGNNNCHQAPRESSSLLGKLMDQTVKESEPIHFPATQVPATQTKTSMNSEPATPATNPTNATTGITQEKREKFLSSINWGSVRRLLFNREAIKLGFLLFMVCGLVYTAYTYKNSNSSAETSLTESDATASQPAVLTESQDSVDNGMGNDAVPSFVPKTQQENYQANGNPRILSAPGMVTENPGLNPGGFDNSVPYSNGTTGMYAGQGQAANMTIPTENMLPPSGDIQAVAESDQAYSNSNVGFDAMPQFNASPEYAPVTPAIGNQYSPSADYESPVLEEEPVDYAGSGIPNNEMR